MLRGVIVALCLASAACGGEFLTSLDDGGTSARADGSTMHAPTADGSSGGAIRHDATPTPHDGARADARDSSRAEASPHDAFVADDGFVGDATHGEASEPVSDGALVDAPPPVDVSTHDAAHADAEEHVDAVGHVDAGHDVGGSPPITGECDGTCICAAGETCEKTCMLGPCTFDCSVGATCMDLCQGYTCTFECPAGSHCANACEGGNCTFDCAPGATCENRCQGGTCNFACPAGAICKNLCEGGNCTFSCAAGSTCENTCAGGACTFDCNAATSTCMDTCSGGVCTGP